MASLPTLERLEELFEYRNGNLYNKTNRNSKSKIGQIAGSYSGKYGLITIDNVAFTIHRIIFFMHHKYVPDYIDHINGNKHDNRIENLRKATKFQNQHNRGFNINNTSGVKNVYWHKKSQKWIANMRYNGKSLTFGSYDSLEKAKEVVREFRENNHKEFANHGQFKEVL
jgi:hypothetical protein